VQPRVPGLFSIGHVLFPLSCSVLYLGSSPDALARVGAPPSATGPPEPRMAEPPATPRIPRSPGPVSPGYTNIRGPIRNRTRMTNCLYLPFVGQANEGETLLGGTRARPTWPKRVRSCVCCLRRGVLRRGRERGALPWCSGLVYGTGRPKGRRAVEGILLLLLLVLLRQPLPSIAHT